MTTANRYNQASPDIMLGSQVSASMRPSFVYVRLVLDLKLRAQGVVLSYRDGWCWVGGERDTQGVR